MAKYGIPIMALSRVDVEADNLEDAIKKAEQDNLEIPGIDKEKVLNWEVNQWEYIEKDDEILADENGNLYISDINDTTKF